jgi:hypothetical protein
MVETKIERRLRRATGEVGNAAGPDSFRHYAPETEARSGAAQESKGLIRIEIRRKLKMRIATMKEITLKEIAEAEGLHPVYTVKLAREK